MWQGQLASLACNWFVIRRRGPPLHPGPRGCWASDPEKTQDRAEVRVPLGTGYCRQARQEGPPSEQKPGRGSRALPGGSRAQRRSSSTRQTRLYHAAPDYAVGRADPVFLRQPDTTKLTAAHTMALRDE